MEELFKSFNDEKIVSLLTSFIALYMSLLLLVMTTSKDKRYKRNANKAFGLLLKANEQHTLNDNAVSLIYKRKIARKYEKVSYASFLEDFLIYVRNIDENGTLTNDISNIINPILEKERVEKPFTNVQERERRILLAIEDSAYKREFTSVKNNLTDLSIVIENNQKALNKAHIMNNWTIPISIIGILLTIFIWVYGSSLSEKDVQRISSQIYSSISDSLHTAGNDSLIINK